jgi:hypothetical protein
MATAAIKTMQMTDRATAKPESIFVKLDFAILIP